MAEWGGQTYSLVTNSLGFKDNFNREVDLQTDLHRVVFIGDSFTEGIGLPFEKTFVGRIKEQLDSTRFEILNAGASSYSPKLYHLKMQHLIEDVGLKMDELHVYIDVSDIQDEIIYSDYSPGRIGLWVSVRHFLTRNVYMFYAVRKSFKIFRSYDTFFAERGEWTFNESAFDKWGSEGLDRALLHMDQLYQLCESNDIKLLIAVYPWPTQIRNPNGNSKQVDTWRDFAMERDISFTNYFPDFIEGRGTEAAVSDFYVENDQHFNARGHELIAQHSALARYFQQDVYDDDE